MENSKTLTFAETEKLLYDIAKRVITTTNLDIPPLFLWGDPGIGKSSLVYKVAERLNCSIKLIRLNEMDPSDLRGLPIITKENNIQKTSWAIPSNLPDSGAGIIFFDELNTASPDMLNLSLQLILNKQLESYKLPDNWFIVAAGNYNNSGYITELPLALKNRFLHIDMHPDISEWIRWAIESKINIYIILFLIEHTDLLFKIPDIISEKTFPTPRSWTFFSNLLSLYDIKKLSDYEIIQLASISVGNEVAYNFVEYFHIVENFNPSLIFSDNFDIKNLDISYFENPLEFLTILSNYFLKVYLIENNEVKLKKALKILLKIFARFNSFGYRNYVLTNINKIFKINKFVDIIHSDNQLLTLLNMFFKMTKHAA